MKKSTFTKQKAMVWVASGAAVLGFAVGLSNIASAADGDTETTVPQVQLDAASSVADMAHGNSGETALTGDVADQVTAAAEAAAPGATVDRVETDSSGHTYEAHVTLEDGTEKVLFFDETFAADGEETLPAGGGHGGPGGHHRGGPGAGETPLTGDVADQVTAAALAQSPGATVDRVETDDTYAYEAHITLEDGTHKVLFFNEAFEYQGEENLPAGHGPHMEDPAAQDPTTTTN